MSRKFTFAKRTTVDMATEMFRDISKQLPGCLDPRIEPSDKLHGCFDSSVGASWTKVEVIWRSCQAGADFAESWQDQTCLFYLGICSISYLDHNTPMACRPPTIRRCLLATRSVSWPRDAKLVIGTQK
ncbi:hypothetical protein KCU74_g26, partial [Aureobasidium melanogenum]